MKGFLTIGLSTYQMYEITESDMDKLMLESGDLWGWPYRFCPETQRVWPKLKPGMTKFFHD